jgi:3-hydroxy-D-aspartate aldolase
VTTYKQFLKDSLERVPLEPIPLHEPIPVEDLHTPALMIDLDIFEKNLDKMQRYLTQNNLGLRSHGKMHKCPIIAKKQIEHGALGICTATVSEAEMMVRAGIEDVLITSPIATIEKIERVIAMACITSKLHIVVDDSQNATALNKAANNAGINLSVYIDLDPPMGRTGVEQGEPALALGRHIAGNCSNLTLDGMQIYIGSCMHIHGYEKRREKYTKMMALAASTRDLFVKDGINVPVFSGGGTGTYNMEPEIGLLTELQAGSYIFMDVEYREIGGESTELFADFEPSLHVLVTAISKPQKKLITVDAGYKSFASDTVKPQFKDIEGVDFNWGGDEHGIILLNNPSVEIKLGDKLPVVTPHCDPTVNLYDYYFPHRDGVVSEIWPIAARGKSQ